MGNGIYGNSTWKLSEKYFRMTVDWQFRLDRNRAHRVQTKVINNERPARIGYEGGGCDLLFLLPSVSHIFFCLQWRMGLGFSILSKSKRVHFFVMPPSCVLEITRWKEKEIPSPHFRYSFRPGRKFEHVRAIERIKEKKKEKKATG